MVIKPLLAFLGTPDLNTVVDEPFHNERCFIVAAAKAVKHENKENIKGAHCRFPLDLLYGITLLGGNLEAGHAFFREFPDDIPAHLCSELMASLFLHGNVIFLNLFQGGNTVQTANFFTQGGTSLRLQRPNVAVLQNRTDGFCGITVREWRKSKMYMKSVYLQRHRVLSSCHGMLLLP